MSQILAPDLALISSTVPTPSPFVHWRCGEVALRARLHTDTTLHVLCYKLRPTQPWAMLPQALASIIYAHYLTTHKDGVKPESCRKQRSH